MHIYPAKKPGERDRYRWHMSADVALHWWFLLVGLVSFAGLAVAHIIDEIPPVFGIIVIAGILGGLVFYRFIHRV